MILAQHSRRPLASFLGPTPIPRRLSPNAFPCHTSENSLVSPIIATLPKTGVSNPCICHISEPPGGSGPLQRSDFQLSTINPVLRYTLLMGILRRLSRLSRAIFGRGTGKKQDHMTHIVAGNTAPGFSLKSLDNKEYSLNTLRARGPVAAAFFKISCPVCQFSFPFLERLHKRYGGDRATFLGISQDDAKSTNNFAKEYGITFPILIDDENGYVVSNAYGLTSVPTIFLIETDGTVKLSCMGFDKKDLEKIAADLAERKKISLAPLFRPDEVIPANKPG